MNKIFAILRFSWMPNWLFCALFIIFSWVLISKWIKRNKNEGLKNNEIIKKLIIRMSIILIIIFLPAIILWLLGLINVFH